MRCRFRHKAPLSSPEALEGRQALLWGLCGPHAGQGLRPPLEAALLTEAGKKGVHLGPNATGIAF